MIAAWIYLMIRYILYDISRDIIVSSQREFFSYYEVYMHVHLSKASANNSRDFPHIPPKTAFNAASLRRSNGN